MIKSEIKQIISKGIIPIIMIFFLSGCDDTKSQIHSEQADITESAEDVEERTRREAEMILSVLKGKTEDDELDYNPEISGGTDNPEGNDKEGNEIVKSVLSEYEKEIQQNNYIDLVLEMIGRTLKKEQYSVCYDDFDNDGDYEMFMAIFDEIVYGVYYVDGDSIWTDTGDDFSGFNVDSGFVKATSETEKGRYEYLKDIDPYDVFLDFNWNNFLINENKICSYYYYKQGEHYRSYTVYDNKPQAYSILINNMDGLVMAETVCGVENYTALGQRLYTGNFFAPYALCYVNGEFGEVASCEIKGSDYLMIDGLADCIEESAVYIKENIYSNGYVNGSGWPFDMFTVKDAVSYSIFYNELGYFVINYMVPCSFEGTQQDSFMGDTEITYYVNQVVNYDGEVNYSGNAEQFNIDTVEGIYAHAIYKYDGENYSRVDIGTGYIGDSVTGNVLKKSICPYLN